MAPNPPQAVSVTDGVIRVKWMIALALIVLLVLSGPDALSHSGACEALPIMEGGE